MYASYCKRLYRWQTLTKNPENCIPSNPNVAVNSKTADLSQSAGKFDNDVSPTTTPNAPVREIETIC